MNLNPLECAVAAKHRVLTVFSRKRPRPSPLESALLSLLASVDSKWLTAQANPFRCNTYKNHRGGDGVQSLGFTEHGTLVTGHGSRISVPSVPLQRNRFGATIPKGAKFLYDPGKQLRSPWCLRIVSGHRELSTDVPGSKPLVLTSALARRPRSSVLAQRALLDRLAGWLALPRRVGKAGSVRLG